MSKARIRSTAGWAAALTREQQLACAYGAIMLASSALNSVFVTFYLNVFMHVSSVTPGWYVLGRSTQRAHYFDIAACDSLPRGTQVLRWTDNICVLECRQRPSIRVDV